MIRLKFDAKAFNKDMANIIEYSQGFLDGVQRGKTELYRQLGPQIAESVSDFIDASARLNPDALHHVYEWYKTGDRNARLFDISYTISKFGISFYSEFKQSQSIKDGSYEPFYKKAYVMESGRPVVIEPKRAEALRFEIDGQEFFTKNRITVDNPGGNTAGQFERVVDQFFNMYFKQSFLRASGLNHYFNNPVVYKKNLSRGRRQGRAAGVSTGFAWVANAGKVAV